MTYPTEVHAQPPGGRPPRRYGVVLATAAVLIVVAAVATFVVPEVFRSAEETPAADERAPAAPVEQNVLLVGEDETGRADSIVLAHLGLDGVAAAVSLPRDSLIRMPGDAGTGRLNQVYALSGPDGLAAAVRSLTGAAVDHYAIVDQAGFAELSTAVGGVPVCLAEATSDPRSGASFPAGEQTLSGADALAFLRQRHGLPNGDLDRIVRHQAFLRSLAGTLADVDLTALATVLREHVRTDEGWDLLGAAEQLRDTDELRFATIPVEGVVAPEGGAALEVDPAEARAAVADLFTGAPQDAPTAGGGDAPCVR